MLRATGLIAILALMCTVADNALAQDNALGFYVGAGLGRSILDRTFTETFTDFLFIGNKAPNFNNSVLGWKAFTGFRPLRWVGGEVEYIDFGRDSQQSPGASGSDRAAAAFAVGYLPMPKPWPELFVKLGLEKVWTHTSFGDSADFKDLPNSQSSYATGFAYGGGLQIHFGALAARLEYERVAGARCWLFPFFVSCSPAIDPSLLSFGLLWTF